MGPKWRVLEHAHDYDSTGGGVVAAEQQEEEGEGAGATHGDLRSRDAAGGAAKMPGGPAPIAGLDRAETIRGQARRAMAVLHRRELYVPFIPQLMRRAGCYRAPMRWVGLTGGIGSGKSAVAQRFAELGAIIIDSDRLAREVVEPGTEGFAEVVAEFGPDVVGPDGALDRAALGRRVFGDEAARRRLEGIIHPRVRTRAIELAAAAPEGAVIINDVPLLVEAGLAGQYEAVIVVFASEETRIARLARDRGMSQAEARSRIAAQATDEQRRAVADIEILNEGTLDELRSNVDAVWPKLQGRAAIWTERS